MPTPAITIGIIHIETLCTPANSNAVWSIGIDMPPTGTAPPHIPLKHVRGFPQGVSFGTSSNTQSPVSGSQPKSSVHAFPSSPQTTAAQRSTAAPPYTGMEVNPIENIVKIEKAINVTLATPMPNNQLRHEIN